MAVPAATQQTYGTIGNREDLSNLIFNISPTECPFTTMAARTKASAVFHEWQTDALAAAATNAQIEGNDVSANTVDATTRLRNYCQILYKAPRVTETQLAVNHAGVDDELDYQIAKRSKELKRDLEYAAVRNQPSSAGGAATARMMASVESWIATNKTSAAQNNAGATTPGYSGGTVAAPTDGTTAGTLVEAMLKNAIQLAWTAGGDPRTLMVGPATKVKVSGFAGIATQYQQAEGKQATIVSGADTYISNFGRHTILPNRFMRDQNILVLDMDYWAIAQLRPFTSTPLAKTGSSDITKIEGEYTLVSRNELASAKVSDINPSF